MCPLAPRLVPWKAKVQLGMSLSLLRLWLNRLGCPHPSLTLRNFLCLPSFGTKPKSRQVTRQSGYPSWEILKNNSVHVQGLALAGPVFQTQDEMLGSCKRRWEARVQGEKRVQTFPICSPTTPSSSIPAPPSSPAPHPLATSIEIGT